MSDQDLFERILASLYEAMLDETLWPATSALLDEACGMQGNALTVGTGPQDNLLISCAGLYYRGERHTALEREYLTVYHSIDERVPRFRQLPDSRIVHATELYTAEELKTSRTYNELLPRARARDGLGVRLVEPDGSHIAWTLQDPVTPGGWEASQLTLIKGLLPHLRQFVRVRLALVGAEALGISVTDLLDTPRLGVIHLDRWGRLMEANDRARRILRHGDGLAEWQGELRTRVPADQARFEQLLAGALPPLGAVAVSGSMTLRRGSGMPPFVTHVKPVGSQQSDFGASRVAALVLLVEPGRSRRLDPVLVAEALRLTQMESQVAVWLAEGKSVNDMAAATGNLPGAIYWHLRQVYQKHGLKRQADLVRLVLSLTEFA